MPVMINDERGEQRELKIGDLVYRPEASLHARVEEIEERYALSRYCVYDASSYVRPSELLLICDAPPKDEEEKSSPLHERRDNLLRNLRRIRDRAEYDLAQKLIKSLSDNDWFWESVAESSDNPRQVSFAPERRFFDVESKRRRCSWAKFLSGKAREHGLTFTDEEVTRLCNLIGRHFPANYAYTFEVVRGNNNVRDAYWDEAGSGWGSCMYRRDYVNWYDENPDKVGVVKVMQGHDYVGRALLWTTDSGETVLDRVYPSDNGPHTRALHDYAEAQGWDYKTRQSCCDGELKSDRWDYKVTMKASDSGSYPYCDTFKYTDDDPNQEEVIVMNMRGGRFCFNGTDGEYSGSRRTRCHNCGRRVDEEEDASYVNNNYYCDDCYHDLFVFLNYRLPSGGYVEDTYNREDCRQCDHCWEYRRSRDIGEVTVGGHYEDWCLICIDGEACRCERCSLFHSCEDSVEIDEQCYCPTCAKEIEDEKEYYGAESESVEAKQEKTETNLAATNTPPPNGQYDWCNCSRCREFRRLHGDPVILYQSPQAAEASPTYLAVTEALRSSMIPVTP